ncbi:MULTISPECIES: helix-turn-helix transcriptional regulator [Photorhabdus]|uniref:Excisionase family DNA binding protein n=1 Tax=Photorhabdus asymbiotica TaxID=291112 RepID=A0ABX9SP72_9GAMM|nr:helix-turn-helix domain-containing protein [Photorhabdus asymbiotica]RKS59846.1 excisionase family DNA binding protein [Photorhabdus asymbiotica]
MKYLTIDEVCEMLSISRRTLERMRSDTLDSRRNEPNSGDVIRNGIGDLVGQMKHPHRISFPKPDFYIGKSPRWERDKLITWLQKNGHRL